MCRDAAQTPRVLWVTEALRSDATPTVCLHFDVSVGALVVVSLALGLGGKDQARDAMKLGQARLFDVGARCGEWNQPLLCGSVSANFYANALAYTVSYKVQCGLQ